MPALLVLRNRLKAMVSRPREARRPVRPRAWLAASAVALALGTWLVPAVADAQTVLNFPARPSRARPTTPGTPSEQMLVKANEVNYDYTNSAVSAVGNVQIYFAGSTLEADRVTYDQKTKKLRAEGNIRLTDTNGQVTYATVLELADNYRDGFVDSLRIEGAEDTYIAAARADRSQGNLTVFQSGVYTACEPCKDNPQAPPKWQVKAARVIHDQGEKMMYFENVTLEFFGFPIAYLPYFSNPDPTVKRKSGFLPPVFSSASSYGYSVNLPYFWALAPDYDVTITPRATTRQGLLMQGEYRQRFETGSFFVRGAGIYQLDKNYFIRSDGSTTPGYRDWRGSLETSGMFAVAKNWVAGWDGTLLSDRTFLQDYGLSSFSNRPLLLQTGIPDAVSQAYLTGVGDRSYFDIRAIHYQGLSESDNQREIPVIHPVIDYNTVFGPSLFGGEVSLRANFTALSRASGSYEALNPTALANGYCLPATADPTVKMPANCLLRGLPGTFVRASAETQWRRTFTDPFGQVWTPFFKLRADLLSSSVAGDPVLNNYVTPGTVVTADVMPTVGLEYRYPFISVQSWGTQTIEPIAQLILRPDETRTTRYPNEDAQSFTFDDTNLFRVDKFSGWDRVEGGGRANVGIQYTAQFNQAGFVNALFGQSFQLFGANSFARADLTNTGLDSGLDKAASDYVARIAYQPSSLLTFSTKYRFDEQNFSLQRFEAEAKATLDRWTLSALYGNYAPQPKLGALNRREGILGSASFKINANWLVNGAIRYDFDARQINQYVIGAGYIDDCLIVAVNYIADYTYSGNAKTDHRILFQIGLRTLGNSSISQSTQPSTTP